MTPPLRVRQGDITTYDGDAVVNAANNHLQLGAGVAGAIRRRGGPTIQEECDRHGAIRVGQAAITGAGDLPVSYVIHAAAMGDTPVTEQSIRDSTAASLELARRNDVKRIAFPVLGSGVGGFDFERAARIMIETVMAHPTSREMEEIVFFGFAEPDARALQAMVDRVRA